MAKPKKVKTKKTKKEKKKIAKKVITKDAVLGEVVRKWPETVEVFFKHGLPCAACAVAFYETVEQGAVAHGIDIEGLLADLNTAAKKK